MESFGHIFQPKQDGSFLIAFQNINKLTENAKTYKSRNLIDHIKHQRYYIMMMTEIGLCWPLLQPQDQWTERIWGKIHDSTTVLAYNKKEMHMTKPIQYGGTGILATREAKQRTIGAGSDDTGLGRWA